MPRSSWTKDQILNSIRSFVNNERRLPRNQDWRLPRLPSPGTVRLHFGSQETCLIAAGVAEAARAPATPALALGWLRQAALENGGDTTLTKREYDAFAAQRGLPKAKAILALLGTPGWADALEKVGLRPGSSRNFDGATVKAILQPVATKWMGERPGEHIGLREVLDGAAREYGFTFEVVHRRMSEECGGAPTQRLDDVIRWLGLTPPQSLRERVLELARKLGHGPSSGDLDEAGIYWAREWPTLVDLYLELGLAPPARLGWSSILTGCFDSDFERRVAEALGQLLEAAPLTAGRFR